MKGSGSHQTHKSIEHQKHECTAANQKLKKKKVTIKQNKRKKKKQYITFFLSLLRTKKANQFLDPT